ncbi:M24 family metallopeptidase [Alkalibacterium kapii]|uniref:Xaa-Pro aminopeptidase n=1 Tax=Alkalibacterium kapii TaxID=426704 RepID=A0A511AY70_9LACT|nr:aminopeptidase P family protein [Alkalibacterium kapii]GEK92091.1 hypothetical protein AKA01nite_17130 [Alkalibacterium kapii]
MNYSHQNAMYGTVSAPLPEEGLKQVELTDDTMKERYNKVISKMKERGLSTLVIYEDLEHGSNFEYLTGFLTRFEEGLLILHDDGKVYYLLGNENLKLIDHARLEGELIHVPHFSLPDQPMDPEKPFGEWLDESVIKTDKKVGVAGWKLFTGRMDDARKLFDVPHYIVDQLFSVAGKENVVNATDLFTGPEGVRTTNNANEVAHYEFGAALASQRMLKTLDAIEPGITERDLGGILDAYGQPNTVVTIAAAGQRFVKANIYPSDNTLKLGDKLSLTVGYKGGLQSRSPMVVHDETELDEAHKDYLDRLVKPYFTAVTAWLEQVHIGMKGKELYDLIETVFPKKEYGWELNPGHLTSDEEWMASPVSKHSDTTIKSGMLFQVDIIPSVKGYPGVSAEGGVIIADEQLQKELKTDYPDVWKRMEARRDYVKNTLNIDIHKDILLSGNATPYLRPYALNKNKAMVWNKNLAK